MITNLIKKMNENNEEWSRLEEEGIEHCEISNKGYMRDFETKEELEER